MRIAGRTSWAALVGVMHSLTVRAFLTRAAARPALVGGAQVCRAATAAASAAATATATTTASDNPLLQMEGLPRFQRIEARHLTPAVDALLAGMERDFAALEGELAAATTAAAAPAPLDYERVLPEVERIQFGIGYVWGVAGHLNGVKNGDELREAYERNQPRIVQAMSQFSQSKPLYDALERLEASWKGTSPGTFEESQRRRAVENSLRGMRLGGVGLEGAAKERFNEIKQRLAQLATTFSNNVLDETKAFSLTVEDPAAMEGVPESARAMWAAAHNAYVASQGAAAPALDPEKGPWRITLDMPSYIAVLSHVRDRSIREQVYRANISRASEKSADKNNVPLIYEILTLRAEMAQMLGYKNYAEQSLASKMAPSVESITELSELIREKALPAAEREFAEITALARSQGGDEYSEANCPKLMPWDLTFWSERLKESKFDLTEEETRPYFALPAVLEGMFSLVERIFNIEVRSGDNEAEVWNKDVQYFKVYDKDTKKQIAAFFLDPYSRPEDKRGGAWMDVCIGKSEATKRDTPVAYLTCNGSPPVGEKPSLMTFREVETLFHEFGHGLQHMLTTATVGDVAGINGVEWDAVELPSQFMENWCYDRPTVYGFAKHWQTGEPMPEEMFEKLKEQKTFGAGMMACRQLLFGQLDLALHNDYDPAKGASGESESIFDVQRRMAARFTPYNMPLEEDRFLTTFSHIFAGGYAAGYYSYKWAEVMSADAFSAFEDVGLDNEEEVRKIGRKFRDTVLSLGGGMSPGEVFKSFRGRDPRPEALLRHNGLV